MVSVAQIRSMIAQGMSDEEIGMVLDDAHVGECDALDSDRADAGWRQIDSQLMRSAWRDAPMFNEAGEYC